MRELTPQEQKLMRFALVVYAQSFAELARKARRVAKRTPGLREIAAKDADEYEDLERQVVALRDELFPWPPKREMGK